jgi:hypothetical protein
MLLGSGAHDWRGRARASRGAHVDPVIVALLIVGHIVEGECVYARAMRSRCAGSEWTAQ